jgi:hypothetical protein
VNLHTSLQTLKTDLEKKEAAFKSLYSLYPYLKGYSEPQLLAYFELDTMEALYQHIQHIQDPHTPYSDSSDLEECSVCRCTDSKGQPKGLYATEAAARKESHTLMMHTKTTLSVYPCPSNCGWHLTKR